MSPNDHQSTNAYPEEIGLSTIKIEWYQKLTQLQCSIIKKEGKKSEYEFALKTVRMTYTSRNNIPLTSGRS